MIIRPCRVASAILALVSMLFMQLVLAGYVCPQANAKTTAHQTMAVSSTAADMAGCEGMDLPQPTLCQASVHTAHQSLDKHELPPLPPFVPASLILILASAGAPATASPLALDTVRRSGAPPPPLAIRHCCFRI